MSEETKNTSEAVNDTAKDSESAKKPKKAKNAELEKALAELENSKDMLLRTAAEFDNYKKRTEREKTTVAEYAKASFAKNLLPVIDNAKRAVEADSASPDYAKGLEMIVKQLLALPEKAAMVELAQVGDQFNPNYHEAVMHIEDEAYEENSIVEILQQGYKIGDTVIRPAMVKVAN